LNRLLVVLALMVLELPMQMVDLVVVAEKEAVLEKEIIHLLVLLKDMMVVVELPRNTVVMEVVVLEAQE
jgi:hypothetical protein